MCICVERGKRQRTKYAESTSLYLSTVTKICSFLILQRGLTQYIFLGGGRGGFRSTLFSVTCLDTLPHAEATIQTCGYLFHDLYTAGWRRVLSAILILCVYTMMIRPA